MCILYILYNYIYYMNNYLNVMNVCIYNATLLYSTLPEKMENAANKGVDHFQNVSKEKAKTQ